MQRCVTSLQQAGERASFCWLATLPYVFGTEATTIPAPIPYVTANTLRRAHWRAEHDRRIGSAGVRVGLVWAGSPDNTADWRRSLPLESLWELDTIPGIRLISLQKTLPEEDRPAAAVLRLEDLSADMTDFAETALVLANLDLVVTVDSAVAHLAGAMGVPTLTLIYEPADWRWMTRREDSPWYPTMRLFRQPNARLITALRGFVAGGAGR